MKLKLKTIICILLFFPIYLLLYEILHEGGHALVILAYGGTIDNFILGLHAYVSSQGVSFNIFGAALNSAAGMLLPTIIGAIALLLYKSEKNSAGYHICYLCATVSLTSSILPWVAIPIISLFTEPPRGDDVTGFLEATGFHPLIVSLGALLLAFAFLFLAYKKGIWGKARGMLAVLQKNVKADRKNILIASCIALPAVVLAVVVINNSMGLLSTPAVLDLSFTDNVLENDHREFTFDIEKTNTYSIDFDVLSQGFITAVRIIDEMGELAYENLFNNSSFTMQTKLTKGTYTLSITYLFDYKAVERFFESTGYGGINPDEISNFKEVFGRDANYSASFSVKIR